MIRYKLFMELESSIVRLRALFIGRVQGVGFRYTVCNLAKAYQVTGFIRNLVNGDVEMVAEGARPELTDFLNSIRSSPLGRHILHDQMEWAAASGTYDGFGVSY